MKGFYVCRIIKEMKPREYKHVRECLCKIYACSQNNMKYQEQNSHIQYIQCKIEKTKNPTKYILSNSCNCKENTCKKNK